MSRKLTKKIQDEFFKILGCGIGTGVGVWIGTFLPLFLALFLGLAFFGIWILTMFFITDPQGIYDEVKQLLEQKDEDESEGFKFKAYVNKSKGVDL